RLDLRVRHAEAAVADGAQHGPLGEFEPGGHGRGEAVAHGGEAVRFEEGERLVCGPGLGGDRLDGADVGGQDRVAREEGAQRARELVTGEPTRPRGGAQGTLEVGAEARDRARLPGVGNVWAPAQL